MVGIPNHMKAIRTTPATTIQRMLGTLNQHQSMNSPRNGHTSGRPSPVSTANTSAQR